MSKGFIPFVLLLMFLIAAGILFETDSPPPRLQILKANLSEKEAPSVDHSKLKELQKVFNSPQEVTLACMSCHTERHKEIMGSSHWNWERPEYIEGRGIVYIGKKNAINNFCIGIEGNELSCAKCHVGYGMKDDMFSYTDSSNIDCLICHDNTGDYVKGSEMGGLPDPSINLAEIAQKVGSPTRNNCGYCHFFGGGGNNVKHGDLEKSMFYPTKEIDVHMAADGPDLQCVDCHLTKNHKMLGKMYSVSSMNKDRSTCEQCHGEAPHEDGLINEHTVKVSCQTCHIPVYAKDAATKMEWDWSTAGKLKDGKPFSLKDENGNETYMSIKGSFVWADSVKPDYIWFNGTADHYLLGDSVRDLSGPLKINSLNGSYADRKSKIYPVKIHKSKQPFDHGTHILIQPKLFAKEVGEGAFWKDFDWQKAAEIGMKEIDLPYTGELAFIETEMYWPVNHMVSAKEESVGCTECHTRENSRLTGLNDFYMPGRDYNPLVEGFGKSMIFVTLFGVVLHGSLRVYYSKRGKK